jgi:parallel beta-helix repeat protein
MVVTGDILIDDFYSACINISHEFVTLDCHGYELTAPLGALLRAVMINDEAHFVTVRNCKLSGNWFIGIQSQASWGLIEHNELGIAGFAIISSGAENEIRHNNILEGGWTAISVGGGDYNLVHHNSVHGKMGGIYVSSSSNEISYNKFMENGVGIYMLDESGSNIIFKNRMNNNRVAGIRLLNSFENLVVGNVANNNGIGIEELGEDLDNVYVDNVCKSNDETDSNIDGACK